MAQKPSDKGKFDRFFVASPNQTNISVKKKYYKLLNPLEIANHLCVGLRQSFIRLYSFDMACNYCTT